MYDTTMFYVFRAVGRSENPGGKLSSSEFLQTFSSFNQSVLNQFTFTLLAPLDFQTFLRPCYVKHSSVVHLHGNYGVPQAFSLQDKHHAYYWVGISSPSKA